jgi:hypothetical protein
MLSCPRLLLLPEFCIGTTLDCGIGLHFSSASSGWYRMFLASLAV